MVVGKHVRHFPVYIYFHSTYTFIVFQQIIEEDGHHHFFQNSQLLIMTRKLINDNCFQNNFIIFL